MKNIYKSLMIFLAFLFLGLNSLYAQCILFPGNLVFTGVNLEDDGIGGTTQNDRFSFVLLQEVNENFEIHFTDIGWTASNSFQTPDKALSDGVIKWIAPAGGVQSGTQITINAKFNLSASLGTVTGVRATPNNSNIYLNLGNSGDQLFAFTGSIENPVFIAGINLNQNWTNLPSDKLTSSESALPTSLNIANVQNASLISGFSNGFTDAVISGNSFNGLFSDIVSEFNQNSNWTFDETYLPDSRALGFQLPKTLTFTVTPFNFLNTPTGTNSITYGANTQFTVSKVDTRNITSYQWQVSINGGADYSDLDDSGIYSGTTSSTLMLSEPQVSNSNYRYRVIAVDACGNEAISNHLSLTVNPRSLTVNLIGTVEKEFDGNTQATISNENLELTGSLDEDDVAVVNPGSGIYASATIGTGILVTVNDLTITGIDVNNYSLSSTSAAANVGIITPAEITGITFDEQSFVFDGTEKSLAISGELPEGTSVAYAINGRTNVGAQEVTATITGSNYTTLILKADLTITPATITGVTFEDDSFPFDGTVKTIEITGTLPEGTSVTYADNTRTTVGSQEATATISGANYTTLILNADLTVTPATITGITFEDGSFVFDGIEKTLEISGDLPDGTSVDYTDNTRTNAGTQEATATISGDNYTTLVLNADLTVTPATITGITFEDGSFVFDGSVKTIEISGTLPDGTSVAYIDNTRTNTGTQEAVATISGSNYTELILNADLTITPATITGITFDDQSLVFDGTEKTLEISGTLPEGASVAYDNNGRTNVGAQEVTATIIGSNYTTLVLTADLTITPATVSGITFEDVSFTFDGSEKTIELTGTLPDGTSVSYFNNTRTNIGVQEATATISGANYTTLLLYADLTITPATIIGITFEDESFVFDGTEKTIEISGTLPDGTSVAYADNTRTIVGSQEATATISGANYTTLILNADLNVTPATIIGITFEDASFTFDGTVKTLEINGILPEGTSVAYADNTRTNAGTQEATATITGDNFTTLVLNANLTVTPATITGITFEDASFVFDETEKSIGITGTIPEGTSVNYTDNTRTSVGTQEATATITGDNFTTLVLNADLTITPATIAGITFSNQSLVFDGTEKSLVISGELPEGTSVTYADNGRTNIGAQEVTATITGSSYTTLILMADLIITPATITGITFDDQSFVFDGTEKTFEISGTLPEGASVAYDNNGRTNVGVQEVTATITGSNFNTLVLTADLTITPATIKGITFGNVSFIFDGTEKTLEITGTLPDGTSVSYFNNTRTNVGIQEATATISGANYTALLLDADLTITPATITGITFEDESFVFDGTEKTIEISGTLPDGTSVAYADNTRTEVGTQEATATITRANFSTLILNAELRITSDAITGITFEDASFTFDGTEKSIEITGPLPEGTSVAYADNARTNSGTQKATATIAGENFSTLVLNADLTITPATITGISFQDQSLVFDGSKKTIEITGTLPEGSSVAYADNTRTDAGTQEATATISGANFTTLVFTADLTIKPATITGITFESGSFVYDGTTKSLAIDGNLPDGTSVAYSNNSRTDVESLTVTAMISGSNYTPLELAAELSIIPADLTIIPSAGQWKVYGETDPALTFTAIGIVDGDDESILTGTLSRASGENVGTYAITQGNLSAGNNYNISFTGADFEIGRKTLTITVNKGQQKYFSEPDPIGLTYSASGFANGDDEGVLTGTLQRAAGEEPGTYAITLGNLNAGDNYEISFIPSDFIILVVKIAEIYSPETVSVAWGTEIAAIQLPETVMVRTDRAEFINLPVIWDMDIVNTFARGTYPVTGELTFASGYENQDGLVPRMEVTVMPKPAPIRVNLSQYEFESEAGEDAIFIAEISVVDPVDNIHDITLINGDRDNGYFEIRNGNQLYWVSADPAAGKKEFFVNFLILDRDGNTLEFLEKLTRHRKSITELFVGNTITPGTDGFNDGWGVPDLMDYEGVRLQIFDRGGMRLFYTLDPSEKWDGTVNGRDVPVGTYYWTIEVVETGEIRKGLLYVLQK